MKRNKLLLILCCLALVTACNNTPSTSGPTQNTPTPTPSHHKIGEKVAAPPWDITIGKGHTQPDFHTEYVSMTPSTPGYVFLVFPVTARNTSATEQKMSALDYRLRDTAGNPYNGSSVSTFQGRVEAGAPLKGTLVFEVPPGERKYVLMFTPTPTSVLVIWDV